jgi:hypothetical protein
MGSWHGWFVVVPVPVGSGLKPAPSLLRLPDGAETIVHHPMGKKQVSYSCLSKKRKAK